MGRDKKTRLRQTGGLATSSAGRASVYGQYSTPSAEMQPRIDTTHGTPTSWAVMDTLNTLRREFARTRNLEAAIALTWRAMGEATYLTAEDVSAWQGVAT